MSLCKLNRVLIAEDDNDDWDIIRECLEDTCSAASGVVRRVSNGVEALAALNDPDVPLPDLVILDLKMPRKNGLETLREIRLDPRMAHLPVVILTASRVGQDVLNSYVAGANSYIVKPESFDGMQTILRALGRYWSQVVTLPSDIVQGFVPAPVSPAGGEA